MTIPCIIPSNRNAAGEVKRIREDRKPYETTVKEARCQEVAIPVVPTVRVVITFAKFIHLPPTDHFYTPLSSPCLLPNGGPEEGHKLDGHFWPWSSSSSTSNTSSSTSVSSWLKRSGSRSAAATAEEQPEPQHCLPQQLDTFVIPNGYTWKSMEDKSRKLKKSKSVRKSK